MQDISFTEAYNIWVSGNSLGEYAIWGISIIWLGRIGKIISFFSAMTIIADILGPVEIRKFGSSLHNISDFKALIKTSFRSLIWLGIVLKKLFISGTDSRPDDSEIKTVLWLYFLSPFPCLVFFLFLISNNYGIITSLFIGIFIGFPLSVIVTFLFYSLGSLLLALIDFLFIEPLAWILEREGLDKLVKILSLFLLLLGVFFDMLAS
jgi:hypothetical protein